VFGIKVGVWVWLNLVFGKTKLDQNAMAQTAMAQASVPAQVFKTKAETKHGLQNYDWAQSLVSPPLGPSTASENHVIAPP
jgi:predicted component of type VI protein secretion system